MAFRNIPISERDPTSPAEAALDMGSFVYGSSSMNFAGLADPGPVHETSESGHSRRRELLDKEHEEGLEPKNAPSTSAEVVDLPPLFKQIPSCDLYPG